MASQGRRDLVHWGTNLSQLVDLARWRTARLRTSADLKINGVAFADLTDKDAEHAMSVGLLAFQDHGHGTIVGFKDVWLKRATNGQTMGP